MANCGVVLRERPVLGVWLLMILCALRPSEALGARWAEIDFVRRVWIIPAARTKRSREHVVPLVPEAIAVLQILAESRSGDLIFPGKSKGKAASHTHFAELPAKLGIKGAACPHGWRSTFRGFCVKAGVPEELAELSLAHTGDAVTQAYRRDETAIERRREVLTAYSNWLTGREPYPGEAGGSSRLRLAACLAARRLVPRLGRRLSHLGQFLLGRGETFQRLPQPVLQHTVLGCELVDFDLAVRQSAPHPGPHASLVAEVPLFRDAPTLAHRSLLLQRI